MPTLTDIEYAWPLCMARVIERKGRQHGVHLTCFQRMRYDAAVNCWVCVACGNVDAGELVAARQMVARAA